MARHRPLVGQHRNRGGLVLRFCPDVAPFQIHGRDPRDQRRAMSSNPMPGSVIPVEEIVARKIISRALYVAVPLTAVCWLLRGPGGAGAGLLGLTVVVLNLWL